MTFSPEVLSIVARGSPLQDRLKQEYVRAKANVSSGRIWERWEEILSPPGLGRRLQWSDRDPRDVREALGKPEIINAGRLPEWAELVAELFNMKFGAGGDSIDTEIEIPFIELYAPVLGVARSRLARMLSCTADNLGPVLAETLGTDAYRSLERSCLERLSEVASRALLAEFNQLRPKGCELLGLLPPIDRDQTVHTFYDRFIGSFTTSGFVPFFFKYPVVARLWATVIGFWAEHVVEFLDRLKEDGPELSATFGTGKPFGRIALLDATVSDPHHRGRSVLLLQFESGVKLAYKPRTTGIEQAYASLGLWLSENGAPFPVVGLKSIDKKTHGWVEFVEHKECRDATRFFENAGALLALHGLLGTTDCHRGNLIANGDHWYLVDLETLLHHESRRLADRPPITGPAHDFETIAHNTVLATGMLPQPPVAVGHTDVDESGLGSLVADSREHSVSRWCGLRSDFLQLRTVREPVLPANNVPRTGDRVPLLHDHLDSVQNGFQKTYRFLQELLPRLLSLNGPLETLRAQRVRFVFRFTQTYDLLSTHALKPAYLQDGAVRSVELEGLARAFLIQDTKPVYWPLLEVELGALENLDLPHFSAQADSQALESRAGAEIAPFFTKSAFERMRANFGRMGEADRRFQSSLICDSLCSAPVTTPPDHSPTLGLCGVPRNPTTPFMDRRRNTIVSHSSRSRSATSQSRVV